MIPTILTFLRQNADKVTTILGLVIAFLQASNISLDRLLAGDDTEKTKLLTALGMGAFGWLTNKQHHSTTVTGEKEKVIDTETETETEIGKIEADQPKEKPNL